MRNHWILLCAIAGLLCPALTPPAEASRFAPEMDITFTEVSPFQPFYYTLDGRNGLTAAGPLNWEGNGRAAPERFLAFCLEIRQRVTYYDMHHYTRSELAMSPVGPENASLIGELWGRHFAEIEDLDVDRHRNKAAAFQVAVWEILYDPGLSLWEGSFVARNPGSGPTPEYLGIAQSWLDSLTGTGPTAHVGALLNPTMQDQLVALAPTPTSALAGGFGLAVLYGYRVLRRRASVAS